MRYLEEDLYLHYVLSKRNFYNIFTNDIIKDVLRNSSECLFEEDCVYGSSIQSVRKIFFRLEIGKSILLKYKLMYICIFIFVCIYLAYHFIYTSSFLQFFISNFLKIKKITR